MRDFKKGGDKKSFKAASVCFTKLLNHILFQTKVHV